MLPPTLFQISSRLLKTKALFHVRQDFADERQDHICILREAHGNEQEQRMGVVAFWPNYAGP